MNKRNLISLVATILMPMFLFGQEVVTEEKVSMSVSGVVASESGDPLAGANVVVEGTEMGAASSEDGSYSIKLDVGSYTITASCPKRNIGISIVATNDIKLRLFIKRLLILFC